MNILSFGGGVQSITACEMAINGDIPKPDHIIFADTGYEPEGTMIYLSHYIKRLKKHFNFHIVKNGNIYTDVMLENMFPAIPLYTTNDKGKRAILRRQCTMQYKIRPITLKIRELCGLKRYQHGTIPVNLLIGLSYDEIERIKENRVKWIKNTYPLIDNKITRLDCKEYLYKNNIEIPPKSACVCCPYRSDAFFNDLKRKQGQEWFELVEYEKKINTMKVSEKSEVFIHHSLKPINKVKFKNTTDLFINECDGYCGI